MEDEKVEITKSKKRVYFSPPCSPNPPSISIAVYLQWGTADAEIKMPSVEDQE